MNVFDVIKENLTTRQIIANEGFYISRNGMMKCPFHDDHHPSLNVKERFKCFACGEYGDGINFVAKLYDIVNNGWHIYLKDICTYATLSKVS